MKIEKYVKNIEKRTFLVLQDSKIQKKNFFYRKMNVKIQILKKFKKNNFISPFFQQQLSRLQQEMLEKCDALQAEVNEAKALREEIQAKYDDVTQKAERIQGELEESKKVLESEKQAFEVKMT